MATPSLVRRNREEFVAFTIRVFCDKTQLNEVLREAVNSAANTEGCVCAEIVSQPRSLRDGEWAEVDEAVNMLADFAESS